MSEVVPIRPDVRSVAAPRAAADIAIKNLHILIVEDDPVDLDLCERYLSMCAVTGHVSRARNAREALDVAGGGNLDCVLLDQHLPDFSGTEIINALKTNADNANLPVIMLTGHGDESLVVEAMHSGAADYMSKKSVSAASLQRAIKNAVEKARLTVLLEHEREVLVETNHQLLAKTREIETFYQTVSHELKTPLTAIREYNSLMIDGLGGPVTDEQKEFLTIAIECCDRLTGLVNDLFDTARMAADKLSVTRGPTRLDILVRRRADELTRTAENAGLAIDVEIAGDPEPTYLVDERRIGQVISNMLTNAIKFTDPGGSIRVLLNAEPDQFSVSVTDTGCGIPATELRSIFERYYQVGDNDNAKAGMGIGLYLCASIAKLHGGEMTVDSEPGKGSKFVLRVPSNVAD